MGALVGNYELSLITIVCINIVLALGLNLIMGLCGQVSLGHAAFYAIGAYTTGVVLRAGLGVWIALPASAIVAAFGGLVVGAASLRVRDDSLAIATLGVNLIVYGYVRHVDFLGGELGITGIHNPWSRSTLGLVALISAVAVTAFALYAKSSWLGFVFRGVAQDELAIRTIGVDDRWYKMIAFAIGTALAGYAGFLLTLYLRSVGPEAFNVNTSMALLPIIVLGGLGSVFGCVIAATIITLFPEFSSLANDYKQLLFGLVVLAVIFLFPGGIAGIPAQWRASLATRRRKSPDGAA
jgi:branched-chain amino acid transport system permease protein